MKKIKNLCCISFLQAVGLVSYVGLVAVIFWKGNEWFGKMNSYFGPLIVLTLFSVSALVLALITLGYPFKLWQRGKGDEALKIVVYTALWIIGILFVFLLAQLI